MKTTDWRSSRKENRPPSEVTNSHSLAISLPLCLLCGHNGRSLPSHHIYNNKPLKNAKWRKCLKMPSCQKQTNYFVESHRNHSCNVKCCAMLCFMVSNCFVAPTLLCIRITALIMFQCVKDSAPTPFSRSGANRSGSGSPILLTEKHIWKLYGWGSAHSSEGPDQSFSKQDLLVFCYRSKRRKGANAKPKRQEQTLS